MTDDPIRPGAPEPTQLTLPAASPSPAGARRVRTGPPWLIGAAGILIVAVAGVALRPGRTNQSLPAAATSAPARAVASPSAPVGNRPVPAAANPADAPIKWTRTRQAQWATDGTRSIGFEVPAERDVRVWMSTVRPILAVRCLSRHVQMFVVTGAAASVEPIDDRHTVHLSFDGGPESTEQWIDSADKQALFAPDGDALAQQILRAQQLRFGFTPYGASPATAEFNVRGFQDSLEAVQRTCGLGARRRR